MLSIGYTTYSKYIAVMVLFLISAMAIEAQDSLSVSVPSARLKRERKVDVKADSVLYNDSVSKPLAEQQRIVSEEDSLIHAEDIVEIPELQREDSIRLNLVADSLAVSKEEKVKGPFVPDPKKALWLSIVFPGGGQIYNRKYWKLPIVYGGFLGCLYAFNWNNTMYRDYSQAYIDIMDDDPNTKSYMNFIPPSYDVDANMTRLKELFKRKKNYYRRYRDMSVFFMIGVYALSIVDAYVDAELSSFDISRDLSMKIRPSVINDYNQATRNYLSTNSYGVQCSISF